MKPGHVRLLLTLLGLQSAACVAFGYDFSDYESASAGSGGSSEPAPETTGDSPAGGSTADEAATTTEGGAAGMVASGGVSGSDDDPVLTTLWEGGAPHALTPRPEGSAGMSAGRSEADGGGGGVGAECHPRDCWRAEAQCGTLDDGCGQPLDCGVCFWWFEACANNRCIIP